jgi:RHS repeat-associated protein
MAEQKATGTYTNPYLFNGKELDEETGLYYYGARYYNPRYSLWLGVDPMAEKYASFSPYTYCFNNPIILVDTDGKEPILPFVGTVSGFVKFMNGISTGIGTATGSTAHTAMLRMGMTNGLKPANTAPFNSSGGNRYIYTEKGGWIDMTHFIFYAGRAYNYKLQKKQAQEFINSNGFAFMSTDAQAYYIKQAGQNPVGEAVQDGYMQEFVDKFSAPYSAFSYEDLPSDKFGAEFGANYFDPNSKQTFSEQLGNYLNNVLKATSPEKAPNYNNLPDKYPVKKPTIQNKTTNPLFTTE